MEWVRVTLGQLPTSKLPCSEAHYKTPHNLQPRGISLLVIHLAPRDPKAQPDKMRPLNSKELSVPRACCISKNYNSRSCRYLQKWQKSY